MSVGRHTGWRGRIYEESPWYASIADALRRFDDAGRFPTPDELSALHAERVEHAQGLPALRFVEVPRSKPRRPKGQPIDPRSLYEGHVIERGEVPTRREDWHDLFNALAFVTFPRAKRALHARQYRILQAHLAGGATRLPNARTREQDALSLFDEGGLVIGAPPHLLEPLQDASEQQLTAHADQLCIVPFGHALYEHMAARAPCPLATAHLVTLPEDVLRGAARMQALDVALAHALTAPTAFSEPSPVRGVSLPALTARDPHAGQR